MANSTREIPKDAKEAPLYKLFRLAEERGLNPENGSFTCRKIRL